MNISFFDTVREDKPIQRKINKAITNVVKNGYYILGKEVSSFESEFANYLGVKHVISVGNGTDALFLSLKAAGIGPGDEVIVPAFTFISTALAVSYTGAMPVLCDSDPVTHLIDPALIEKVITKKTKAIIPVHLYGNPANMGLIITLAKKYKLLILEDAAQAHGAVYKKRKVGTIGNIAAFSFYPTKNLGCYGDGGAIATNDDTLAENALLLRNYGQKKKYFSQMKGYNSRLDEIQAAILRIKLSYLERHNAKRRVFVKKYQQQLKNPLIDTPLIPKDSLSSHYLFTIQINKRDELQSYLEEKGIQTLIHYPIPVHLQEAYKDLKYKKGSFPIAEKIAETTLSLPLYAHITKKEIEDVCNAINAFSFL